MDPVTHRAVELPRFTQQLANFVKSHIEKPSKNGADQRKQKPCRHQILVHHDHNLRLYHRPLTKMNVKSTIKPANLGPNALTKLHQDRANGSESLLICHILLRRQEPLFLTATTAFKLVLTSKRWCCAPAVPFSSTRSRPAGTTVCKKNYISVP